MEPFSPGFFQSIASKFTIQYSIQTGGESSIPSSWAGGGVRRGQPEETETLCEPGTPVGGRRGRALGLKKNLQMVFLPSLVPSLVVIKLITSCPSHAEAFQEPLKIAKESKLAAGRSKSSARHRGKWGKRRKTKRKANCAPKPQAAGQSFFFTLIF